MDQPAEEHEWIRRCLHGETVAFRPLLERYERMVRAVIRRLVDVEHEVDELAQQTFISAYENLTQYSHGAKFSTWLCQIALNKSRDHLRARVRRRDDTDIDEVDCVSEAAGPDGLLQGKQLDAQLQAALHRLKQADRELIVFKYVLGYDYETVAQILGCTPEAAKVRSHRARVEMKQLLERMGIEP